MSSNIKTVLNEYIKIDDELKVISKQATALRNQKKSLAEQINDYLESSSSGDTSSIIEMGKNTFKLIKYTKKKVSKINIEEILKKSIKNEEQVKAIIEDITEETEESYIKRSVKK
jgi:hypothetical protein